MTEKLRSVSLGHDLKLYRRRSGVGPKVHHSRKKNFALVLLWSGDPSPSGRLFVRHDGFQWVVSTTPIQPPVCTRRIPILFSSPTSAVREDLEQNFIWEFFYHTLLKWAVLHRPGSLVFIFIYRIKSGTILIKRRDNANSTYFSGYRPLPTELLRETGRERE